MEFNIPSPGAAANQATADRLDNQMRMQQLAMAPLQQNLLRTQAAQASMQLQSQQRFAQAAKDWIPKADDMSENLQNLAMLAFKSGDIQAGEKLMTSAQMAIYKTTQVENMKSLIEKRQMDRVKEGVEYGNRLAGQIDSQQSLDFYNSELERLTGQPSTYKGQSYTPELAQEIQSKALSFKDKFDMRYKEQQEADRMAREDRIAGHNQTMEQIARDREDEKKRHDMVLEKNGGGSRAISAPNKDERGMAERQILDIVPGLKGNELEKAKDFVSSEAKRLRNQNHALDPLTATAQAVMKARQLGYFKEQTSHTTFGGFNLPGQDTTKHRFDMSAPQVHEGNQLWQGKPEAERSQIMSVLAAHKGDKVYLDSFKKHFGFLPKGY